MFQNLKGFGISEEIGHPDEHVFEKNLNFRRGLLKISDILSHLIDLVDSHAPLNPAANGRLFVMG